MPKTSQVGPKGTLPTQFPCMVKSRSCNGHVVPVTVMYDGRPGASLRVGLMGWLLHGHLTPMQDLTFTLLGQTFKGCFVASRSW